MSAASVMFAVGLLFVGVMMLQVMRGPCCVGCGGRLKHTDDCPLRKGPT